MKKSSVIFLMGLMGLFLGWNSDPTVNTPVCTESGMQSVLRIVTDGSGGSIIVWRDGRNGNYDIYAQRLNASGIEQWTPGGVAVCGNAGGQYAPAIVPDGSGGAVITWYDYRDLNADIYVQRVNSAGNVLWTANGVAVCTAFGEQYDPVIAPDGDGGAIIAWYDFRYGDADIFVQRVNSTGNPVGTPNGTAVCLAADNQVNPVIVSDGSVGAIITWTDYRSGSGDIYAQRMGLGSLPLWTADGMAVCTAAGEQYDVMLTPDGDGGAIIAWTDSRGGNADIYSQRVNYSGIVQWTANGVAVCAASGDQYEPMLTPDSSGGAVIAWRDIRGVRYDIYTQRLDSGGNSLWTVDGVAVCAAADDQLDPVIVSDGSGGGVVTWYDYRSGTLDIYAQRVDGNGNTRWTADGVAVCSEADNQIHPVITSDGSGGAIIAWEDCRNGLEDIYAQRVCGDGSLGDCLTDCTVRARVAGGHGMVSPEQQSVTAGGDATVNIYPDSGYRVAGILDNDQSMPIASPYVIENVGEFHEVVVSFGPDYVLPAIALTAERKTERAWVVEKDYGDISVTITEASQNPAPVARYILYRSGNGGAVQVATFTDPGTHPFQDKYLEKDQAYTYQVTAVDGKGQVVTASDEAEI